MEYTEKFKKFVKNGVNEKYFIGTGNPNSKILFIGKESAISKDDIKGRDFYNKNADEWQNHINKGTCEILKFPINKNHQFRKEKSWGKNTWSKYQILKNIIYKSETQNYINFLEDVFTTEINDAPEKTTSKADKSGLNSRKELFNKSKFIQDFPVTVLACSDYIKNNNEVREIDNIFQVTFDNHELNKYYFSKGNWFFTHHNNDKSKLVIHTRQLSANVNNDMLEKMGEIIRQHLEKMNLLENKPTTSN
ncbi:hypothetical protein [Tenacibaculum finnmarkense]|uniref:hypothetical protein n=1 Tax=Tenacibaculum finnmarkense TaxID=2781243 RepID=UPI001EFC2254|nr:hypothetical protein [Tenacibaculum finnmarkense]MCG8733183.1 hypothetical protein [Tenacibaculum finnmarkense]